MKLRSSSLGLAALFFGVLGSSAAFGESKVSGDWLYRVDNNAATIVGYNGGGGDVVFPSEIEGMPVTHLMQMFGKSNNTVTSVEIPDSVTSINCATFDKCTALTSVSIGKGVTHLGYGVFNGCGSLTNVSVAEDNPAYSALDGVLFDKDKKKLLTFPGGKAGAYKVPEGVTAISGDAFMGENRLTELVVPESVTTIDDFALGGCRGLEKISLPAKFSDKLRDLGLGANLVEKLNGPVSSEGGDSLTVGDVTYEDVQLKKEYPASFFIHHSGGTAFIEKVKLTEDQVASLVPAKAQ